MCLWWLFVLNNSHKRGIANKNLRPQGSPWKESPREESALSCRERQEQMFRERTDLIGKISSVCSLNIFNTTYQKSKTLIKKRGCCLWNRAFGNDFVLIWNYFNCLVQFYKSTYSVITLTIFWWFYLFLSDVFYLVYWFVWRYSCHLRMIIILDLLSKIKLVSKWGYNQFFK